MKIDNFFAELKRRNVYKVAVAYAVVGWLVIQISSTVLPTLVVLVAIGFPIALVIAWAFELTPEGLKRTEDVDLSKSIARTTGRKLDFLIIGVLLLVIAVLIFQRLHPHISPGASTASEKSLAVLPFENLSRDPENEFFTNGVQDEILSHLSKVADLRVISRTSVMQYKAGAQRNLRDQQGARDRAADRRP